MRVALTGASGFIGSAIARHAAEAGHEVTALMRQTSRQDHVADCIDRVVTGTQDDPSTMEQLLDGADVVVHNSFDWSQLKMEDSQEHLTGNLVGSIKLLEASANRHFIYISSVAVHHYMHSKWNGVIDESHPTRPGTLYGACKAAVEAHLWSANAQRQQPVTSIRPCGVYGVDPRRERSIGWPIIESIRRGEPYTRKGGGKFVHVEDVAAATVACIGNPLSSPKVYTLVDCYARWGDIAMMVNEILGTDVSVDLSSPEVPKNNFDTTDVKQDLGVSMNRGHAGIRTYLAELVELSKATITR